MSGPGPLTVPPQPAVPSPSSPPWVFPTDVSSVVAALTFVHGQHFAFFWKETEGPFRMFANWFPSEIRFLGGVKFATAEHALMYSKAEVFDDSTSAALILAAPTPKEAKDLGRQVAGFDQSKWDSVKGAVMCRILFAKFAQNPNLLAVLLNTGDARPTEVSPYDGVWGAKISLEDALRSPPHLWTGEDMLGVCLEKVRKLHRDRLTDPSAFDPDIGPCASTPRLDEVIRYVRVKRPRSPSAVPNLPAPASESPPLNAAPATLPPVDVPTCTPLSSSDQLTLLFLVATAGVKPLVLLPVGEGEAIGAPATSAGRGDRTSAVTQAARWLRNLVPASLLPLHAFLGGETAAKVRVVVAPLAITPPSSDTAHKASTRISLRKRGARFAWFAVAALAGSPVLHHAASLATQRIRTFSDLSVQGPAFPMSAASPFLVGARPIRALVPRMAVVASTSDATTADKLIQGWTDEQLLRDELNVPASHPHASYLHSLIDRVGALDLADLTANDKLLSEKAAAFGDPNFQHFRFSDQPRPPDTVYESAQLAQPSHCYEVTFSSPRDLLTDLCWSELDDWSKLVRDDLVNIRDNPTSRRRPAPFVRGQSCFVPKAQGCVWDLRVPGVVQAHAFNEPLSTTLDLSSIERAFPGGWGVQRPGVLWPDQRLISYLAEGVRFEVNHGLPLQIVMFPHLQSMPPGFSSLQSEVRRMLGLPGRWCDIFTHIPFLPIRCVAHGATPRVYENRWRSTTEAGGPRYLLLDPDGIAVPALNDLSREFGHPKEVKPTPAELAHDLAILSSGGAAARLPVYAASDDVKDYFQHLPLATSEHWFSTFITLAENGDPGFSGHAEGVSFVTEYRLGFGHVSASNVAQRLSTLIVALIELEFEVQYRDQLEALAAVNPVLADWLAARASLPLESGRVREDRLHTIKMYTDDLALVVVGAKGMVAMLIAEHLVFQRLNFVMAVAAKRTLGSSFLWLGVVFVTCAGLVFVPRAKILRALLALKQAIEGELSLAHLRSLLGLLEHIKGVLRVSRTAMHGLWRPFKGVFDPALLYSPPPWAISKLVAWSSALSASAGTSIFNLLPRSSDWLQDISALARFAMRVSMSADAARAHLVKDRRGLGGFFHGFYFYFPLPPLAMELLAIGILELLALLFAILTFYDYVPPNALVDLETDSLSSTFSVADDIARTREGQIVVAAFASLTRVRDIFSRGTVAHIFGSANACADDASRGKIEELRELCLQMGVRAFEVPVPPAAVQVFRQVFAHAAQEAGREQEFLLCMRGEQPSSHPPPQRSGSSDTFLAQEVIKYVSELAELLGMGETEQTRAATVQPTSKLARLLDRASASPRRTLAEGHRRGESSPFVSLGGSPSGIPLQPRRSVRPTNAQEDLAATVDSFPTGSVAPNFHTMATVGSWEGPASGATFSKRKRRSLPDDWVTLSSLRALRHSARRAVNQDEHDRLALRPSDPSAISRLDHELQDVLDAETTDNSLRKDESSWNKYWIPVVTFFNTPQVREPPDGAPHFSDAGQLQELKLLCFALLLIMKMMPPRAKRDKSSKPDSWLAILLAVRRMHNRLGILMVPFKLLSKMLKGLKRRFVFEHGVEALLARRKKPIFFPVLVKLLAVMSVPLAGGGVWERDSLLGASTVAMICLLYSSGFRKAEITTSGPSSSPLVFSCLVWNLRKEEQVAGPNRGWLQQPSHGDFVAVYPLWSKCDFTGEIWGDKPSYHHYSDEVGNAFSALADLELRARVVGDQARRTTPLFINNDFSPVSPYLACLILDAMLLTFLSVTAAFCYTWHSFRIGLATRLHRAKVSDSDIQAICRWQSTASLKIYIKMVAEDYLEMLSKAHRQEGTVGSHPTVMIDSVEGLNTVGPVEPESGTLPDVASLGNRRPLLGAAPTTDRPSLQRPEAGSVTSLVANSTSPSQAAPPPPAQTIPSPRAAPSLLSITAPQEPLSPNDASKLPPGWWQVRSTVNKITGAKLARGGFSEFFSPNGTKYRSIKLAWIAYRQPSRQQAVQPAKSSERPGAAPSVPEHLAALAADEYGVWEEEPGMHPQLLPPPRTAAVRHVRWSQDNVVKEPGSPPPVSPPQLSSTTRHVRWNSDDASDEEPSRDSPPEERVNSASIAWTGQDGMLRVNPSTPLAAPLTPHAAPISGPILCVLASPTLVVRGAIPKRKREKRGSITPAFYQRASRRFSRHFRNPERRAKWPVALTAPVEVRQSSRLSKPLPRQSGPLVLGGVQLPYSYVPTLPPISPAQWQSDPARSDANAAPHLTLPLDAARQLAADQLCGTLVPGLHGHLPLRPAPEPALTPYPPLVIPTRPADRSEGGG